VSERRAWELLVGRRVARRAFAAVLCLAAFAGAPPAPAQAGHADIGARGAWLRATAPGTSVGVAYLEIVNDGPDDELLSVTSPVARRVEMHSMTTVGEMMQMRELATLKVPGHSRIAFAPGGLHLMLIDLRAPLKEGATVPLVLHLRGAGTLKLQARVQGLGAMAPPVAQ
jgi:copper(I)-binding protein